MKRVIEDIAGNTVPALDQVAANAKNPYTVSMTHNQCQHITQHSKAFCSRWRCMAPSDDDVGHGVQVGTAMCLL